jgi:PEGA domain
MRRGERPVDRHGSVTLVWLRLGIGGRLAAKWWDRTMSRVIALVACGLMLAACSASLPSMDFFRSSPSTEALRIESEPPGADARTSQGQSCRTPCELAVQGAGEMAVTVTLAGYQPQTVPVRPDQGEGKLGPNPLYVELVAMPATPAKKPRKKKRPATVAAQPAAAQPAPAASASAFPPPPPTAAAEPSSSSSAQYPWPSR